MNTELESAEIFFTSGNPTKALEFTLNYIANSDLNSANEDNVILDYKAGCLLIDIGDNLRETEVIRKGVQIIDQKRYEKYFSKSSIEYNLGNGKKALFDSIRYTIKGKYNEEILKLAIEAKNHFLRALNTNETIESELKCQIIINAANVLDVCGRPTEAIYLHNQALSMNSERYEAHASKAIALQWLNNLSSIYTAQMLLVTKYHLEKAIYLAPIYRNLDDLKNRLNSTEFELSKLNIVQEKYSKKHRLKIGTSRNQSLKNYFLNNNLYLSHHSCYCSCDEAVNDEIINKRFLPNRKGINRKAILLRLLRRIISEYILARNLLGKGLPSIGDDFFGNEELLRAAYRICYGTLDKIARLIVISEMGDIASNSQLLFESFWRNYPSLREKAITSESYNLFALYSIATDLQMKEGELRFFKDWRNAFEHSLIVITNAESININQDRILTISKLALLDNLTKLLRIVRSAIFSSVFLLQEPYKN